MRDKKGRFLKGHTGFNNVKRPNCLYCGNKVQSTHNKKYCSHKCYTDDRIGSKQSVKHRKAISRALKGKKKSEEHRLKVIEALNAKRENGDFKIRSGKQHPSWKGDDVGYCGIHDWIEKNKDRSKTCDDCGVKDKKLEGKSKVHSIHYANISGKYLRDINDWKCLCRRCHYFFDKGRNSIKKEFIENDKRHYRSI